ncbi:gephyrin-like molybdotransferase Glp [Leifsonia sp. A12D58]|uniref:molybdopterin molybdotransferase MoeA n=1 Tax=Leifsonia sp. A12D58 TaxID=3397674 RepID=UPI0039E1ED5D
MTTVDDHALLIERMLAPRLATLAAESVSVLDALGRVTAVDVRSAVDLPLFRNSQMDGFAVRAADVTTVPVVLPVSDELPAGPGAPQPLLPGTAARIMTGAPVPDRADAIIPVEDTEPGAGPAHVTITRTRGAGEFVRERGSDLSAGDQLVSAGVLLAPRHLAALAAAGISEVVVRRKLRVAVITTGSELVAHSEIGVSPAPSPGQIFDANQIALVAAITEAGAEVSIAARSTDDLAIFRRILDDAIAASDLVITSGGISMGAYEVVRDVLEPLGASVGHVDMQPGGPQATAVIDGVPVVCFPGNPVSTQVSFVVFVRALLHRAAGRSVDQAISLRLAKPITSVAGKRQFLRGAVVDDVLVEQVAGTSSHLVAAMARADVLIDVPADVTALEAGTDVRVWTL